MNRKALDEVLSSRQKLRIADLVSLRPRALRELADLTGISVQGVVKHLTRMEELGLVTAIKVKSKSLSVRKVYSIKGVRIGDFSHGDLTVVKVADEPEPLVQSEDPYRDLESLAADALIQKRRIGDQIRRLGRMIDELESTETRIGTLVRGLSVKDEERLLLHAAFTEDTFEDAERSLRTHYRLKDARRALEKAISRAKKLGKK